jgi:hypothetical protein
VFFFGCELEFLLRANYDNYAKYPILSAANSELLVHIDAHRTPDRYSGHAVLIDGGWPVI